jgi:hypothetical protein
LENKQAPLSVLQQLRFKGGESSQRRSQFSQIISEQNVIGPSSEQVSIPNLSTQPNTARLSNPFHLLSVEQQQHFSFPPAQTAKLISSLPPVITSTKVASAKLVKLKGELFNILYSFPEKALKWTLLDEESEQAVQSAGDEAFQLAIQATTSNNSSLSEEEIQKVGDKAARKTKRRLRRKLAVEKFGLAVQTAITPQELLQQVLILEGSIPEVLTFKSMKEALPQIAPTVADVAQRLFVLDRTICYDLIGNLDAGALFCPFKLRTQFSPRCHAHAYCIRFMGHTGKCSTGANQFSRLPDQFLLAPPSDPFSQQQQHQQQQRNLGPPLYKDNVGTNSIVHSGPSSHSRSMNVRANYQFPTISKTDLLPRLATLLDKPNADIEREEPYLPAGSEILVSAWI